MATKKYKFTFLNGKVVTLTTGEMNAIERFAHQNGTDPAAVQYDPGSVHFATRNNLVSKGILRKDSQGWMHFVAGLLPVSGATVYSTRHFSLTAALAATQARSDGPTEIRTLVAEDFKVGFRYWSVRPGCEDAWTIASVTVEEAEYQVMRGGEMVSPMLVTITRRDGNERTFEKGEMVAIQGPWKTEDAA